MIFRFPSLVPRFLMALLYMPPTEMVDLYFGQCVPSFLNKVLYCTSEDLLPRLYRRLLGETLRGKRFIISALSLHIKAMVCTLGKSTLPSELLFQPLIQLSCDAYIMNILLFKEAFFSPNKRYFVCELGFLQPIHTTSSHR